MSQKTGEKLYSNHQNANKLQEEADSGNSSQMPVALGWEEMGTRNQGVVDRK